MTDVPDPLDMFVGFSWGFVVASYLLAEVTWLVLPLLVVSVGMYLYGYLFDEERRRPDLPEEGSA